jgi:hypothetical protein
MSRGQSNRSQSNSHPNLRWYPLDASSNRGGTPSRSIGSGPLHQSSDGKKRHEGTKRVLAKKQHSGTIHWTTFGLYRGGVTTCLVWLVEPRWLWLWSNEVGRAMHGSCLRGWESKQSCEVWVTSLAQIIRKKNSRECHVADWSMACSCGEMPNWHAPGTPGMRGEEQEQVATLARFWDRSKTLSHSDTSTQSIA